MNLPSGIPVKQGLDAASVDFLGLLQELRRKAFNGYACVTVQGAKGIEEGTIVFDSGKIVASFYEYLLYDKVITGDKAFVRVMNASAAKTGVIDLYQLTNEQVQLILAFNEQAISIPSEADVRRLAADEFSPLFEGEVAAKKAGEDRKQLLKKYRLTGVD